MKVFESAKVEEVGAAAAGKATEAAIQMSQKTTKIKWVPGFAYVHFYFIYNSCFFCLNGASSLIFVVFLVQRWLKPHCIFCLIGFILLCYCDKNLSVIS